jgi:hypothetical protein
MSNLRIGGYLKDLILDRLEIENIAIWYILTYYEIAETNLKYILSLSIAISRSI